MPRHPLRGATAITGLGLTPQGKVYGSNAIGFAVDAQSHVNLQTQVSFGL